MINLIVLAGRVKRITPTKGGSAWIRVQTRKAWWDEETETWESKYFEPSDFLVTKKEWAEKGKLITRGAEVVVHAEYDSYIREDDTRPEGRRLHTYKVVRKIGVLSPSDWDESIQKLRTPKSEFFDKYKED